MNYLIFLGLFPSAFIAGKIKKIDIRYAGSRNIGGMNTFSIVEKLAGILILAAGLGKGALMAFIAAPLLFTSLIPLLAVIMAMIGHNWVTCSDFKGGRGVSISRERLCWLLPFPCSWLFFAFWLHWYIVLRAGI
ncbi:MAG: glycerol-3-phosphate acyltransferase [Actinomycetia bacterium]|nr:glycerol-3-phosphate acyltransferase [Actinomycetes bacterium]